MRRLARIELLIFDDFALQASDQTETAGFYELLVERHHKTSTIAGVADLKVLVISEDVTCRGSTSRQSRSTLRRKAYRAVSEDGPGEPLAVLLAGRGTPAGSNTAADHIAC